MKSNRPTTLVFAFLLLLPSPVSGLAVLRTKNRIGENQTLRIPRGGAVGSSSTALSGVSAVASTLDTFWKSQNPFVTAALVAGTKAVLADLVAQKRQQQQQPPTDSPGKTATMIDRRRSLSFLIYGSLYQGCAQELIYNNLYTYLFGSATTAKVVVRKVLFDAVFHNALVCIPMAYAVKALVYGTYSVREAIKQYIDDVLHHGLLLKYYAIWMPVNAMIFTIIPPHWRISVMAAVSFFWMMILSTISSRKRE